MVLQKPPHASSLLHFQGLWPIEVADACSMDHTCGALMGHLPSTSKHQLDNS